jgi:hypothetical protein
MGEQKANSTDPRRLIVRLDWPTDEKMVVEVSLEGDFLERAWKLMFICEKILRTMHGRAKVIIQDSRCNFVGIHSEAAIQRLLTLARAKEWHQLQYVWIPNNLLLGCLGQCRVMAGMRGSQTIVDQDAFWFEGSDGTRQFASLRLAKEWVRKQLTPESQPF